MMNIDLSKNKTPSPLQQAGLVITRFNGPGIELTEITGANILRLHSLENVEQLRERFAEYGLNLPEQTNQSTGHDPSVLCLRPHEWLLFSEQPDSGRMLEKLRSAIDPAVSTLLNTSDALATFRLSGRGAAWLLAKLSGLDFIASSSNNVTPAEQNCARTRVADIAVIVHYHPLAREESGFVFDLLLDRSVASYLWKLLLESAPHADELSITFGDTT